MPAGRASRKGGGFGACRGAAPALTRRAHEVPAVLF